MKKTIWILTALVVTGLMFSACSRRYPVIKSSIHKMTEDDFKISWKYRKKF